MDESWPFDQPRNCATITVWTILNGEASILMVSHDTDDHGWQFLDGWPFETSRAALVSLKTIVELDPTVQEVADLPPGWTATRERVGAAWKRWPPDKR
ncbi:MAG: hypothetical protein AAF797_13545 [Planctomycetota bacterium]